MPLDRVVANIFVSFGSVCINKEFCRILMGNMKIQREAKTEIVPSSGARSLAIFTIKLGPKTPKMAFMLAVQEGKNQGKNRDIFCQFSG